MRRLVVFSIFFVFLILLKIFGPSDVGAVCTWYSSYAECAGTCVGGTCGGSSSATCRCNLYPTAAPTSIPGCWDCACGCGTPTSYGGEDCYACNPPTSTPIPTPRPPTATPTPTCEGNSDGDNICNLGSSYCQNFCREPGDGWADVVKCYTNSSCALNLPYSLSPCYSTGAIYVGEMYCPSAGNPIPTSYCHPYQCQNVGQGGWCTINEGTDFPINGCPAGPARCDNCGGADCSWCPGTVTGVSTPVPQPTTGPGCTESCLSDPRYAITCNNTTFSICSTSINCYGGMAPNCGAECSNYNTGTTYTSPNGCGTCDGCNSFPQFITGSLVIKNSNNILVPGEPGGTTLRNHICQTTFQLSGMPRRVRFEVSVTDGDGWSSIVEAGSFLRWNSTNYPLTKLSGSGLGGTMYAIIDFPVGNPATGVEDIYLTVVDSTGGSTGLIDSDRDFKAWDCQVPVSGNLYDGSAAVACPATGFSELALGVGFTSLIFDGTITSDVTASVSPPANFGSNNLVWGYFYLPLFNGGDASNPDGDLAASGRTTRLIDLGTGTTSCTTPSFDIGTWVSPYSLNPRARVDFSFIRNQLGWFQVGGAGVKGKLGISSGVPVTVLPEEDRALSVAIARASNGLVSSPFLTNINGFNEDSAHGTWWINRNTNDSSSYSYQSFYNTFYVNGGVGTTGTNWAGRPSTGIYFVNGNLNIDSGLALNPEDYLMVVARGTITIDSGVNRLDGIYMADGGITATGTSATQLLINGTLYSRSNIRLGRSYMDRNLNNTSPAVRVNYNPNLIFNMPGKLMRVLNGWRED